MNPQQTPAVIRSGLTEITDRERKPPTEKKRALAELGGVLMLGEALHGSHIVEPPMAGLPHEHRRPFAVKKS